MCKGRIFKIFFIMLILTFCPLLSTQGYAASDCNKSILISTDTGNREYPPGWNCTCDPYEPIAFDPAFNPENPEKIICGTDVTIPVIGGCPPFEWEVSGNGYTLTMIDERNYTLSCSGST